MTIGSVLVRKLEKTVQEIGFCHVTAFLVILLFFGITFNISSASPPGKELSPVVPADYLGSLSPDDLLELAVERCRSLESYQCRLTLHVTRGDREQDGEYIFSYKKPSLVRMHVENGRDKGSTVILRADGRIRGRREGILSIFAVTLQPNDQRLYDLWNRSFYKSDWVTLLCETKERLRDGQSTDLKVIDNGRKVLLDISGRELEEKTWLDSESLVLLRKQARMNNGDYLDAVWSDISLNPPLDDQFFSF